MPKNAYGKINTVISQKSEDELALYRTVLEYPQGRKVMVYETETGERVYRYGHCAYPITHYDHNNRGERLIWSMNIRGPRTTLEELLDKAAAYHDITGQYMDIVREFQKEYEC